MCRANRKPLLQEPTESPPMAAKTKKEQRAEKLGTKRACPECEAKFYDLNANPATCPICQNSFDTAELDEKGIAPVSQLKSNKPKPEDEDDEDEVAAGAEVDEDDIDEEEEEAKALELDGDDVAIIGGATGDDEENPDLDNIDDDEDEDAALVADDDEPGLPPGEGDDDDDDEDDLDIELDTDED